MVLETTRRCNLRCIHCAVSEENNLGHYQSGDLPIDFFRKLLPMLRESKPVVQLSGHGETLLHPHFMEMLEAVADAGCRPILQTNGTLLNARIAERLVQLGVEQVTVSIDGASAEVFDRIRRRASLEKILANIRQLNQTKRRFNKLTPHLGLEFVAFRQNIHELPDVIRMAGELGAGHVQVAELHEYIMTQGESLVNDPIMADWAAKAETEARKWDLKLILPPHIPGRDVPAPASDLVTITTLPQSGEAAAEAASSSTSTAVAVAETEPAPAEPAAPPPNPHKGMRKTCREPWEKISVQYNGDCWPCCVITESYGNLSGKSFEEIWTGPKYQALRASLESDEPYPICAECPFYGWEPIEPATPAHHLRRLLDRMHSPDPHADALRIESGQSTLRDICLALLEADAPTDAVFIDRLYRRLLDRPPDTAGYHGWIDALANGTVRRAKVLRTFLCSGEFNKLLEPYANPVVPPYLPGADIHCSAGAMGLRYTGDGWAGPEDWGV